MSLWGLQADEDWISGAKKSKSGWHILGNLEVYCWHDTGNCNGKLKYV